MKEFCVTKADQGQRLSKYLDRILKEAGSSFIYKMLRKKNITLNGKKADGSEQVKEGDVITLFLSDETFQKFSGLAEAQKTLRFSTHPIESRSIIFEDEHLMVVYKPAGILSQKDKPDSESINEQILQYLIDASKVTAQTLAMFHPSVCNRLDRNTSGLILFAKTLSSQQQIARCLKERTLKKYYLCLVAGKCQNCFEHKGYLTKDSEQNMVTITKEPLSDDSQRIHTKGEVLTSNDRCSLLRIELITGKSHQIRAVLETMGYPVLGEKKYIGSNTNQKAFQLASQLNTTYMLRFQLLLSYEYDFPEMAKPLEDISNKKIFSPIPKSMANVIQNEFPGYRIPRA